MGEPATPIRRRIELTIAEARLRFQQLVRVTGLTGQVTVVVDNGRPIAAIVPVTDLPEFSPPPPPPPAPPPPPPARPVAPVHAPPGNDGWLRRVEKVREDVRRQHAGRIRELTRALDEAWEALDAARPAGTDRVVDALRAAHADLRPPR
ncbi:hypothetical protein AB0F72_05960 [Actinoplanes sp. NPDC023936]|uniref:hypothetical protein n=1 Tax=Actinoplanes sp. NPDC023936 TaxID=3154910 RepID=UPI0033E45288